MPERRDPGAVLSQFLEKRKTTADELARQINVPSSRIAAVIEGREAITADLSLRLGHWLNMTPESWLYIQADWDLHLARQSIGAEVETMPVGQDQSEDELDEMERQREEDRAAQAEAAHEATLDKEAARDFAELSKRLRRISENDVEDDEIPYGRPRRARMSLEVPIDWLMLACWREMRGRDRAERVDSTIQNCIPDVMSPREIAMAKRTILFDLRELHQLHLHGLSIGDHYLLTPFGRSRPAQRDHSDGDDPF